MKGSTRSRSLFEAALTLTLVLCACGGGTKGPETAAGSDAAGDSAAGERDDEDSSSDSEGEGSAAAAKTNPCDDGTCTPCGEGHCPIGWYCDESAKGGPSCGWLPECTKKPSCACVKRALGGTCEERDGGLYLKSD